VVRDTDPQVVADALDESARRLWSRVERGVLRDKYAPDFARVPATDDAGTPEYILTWTRIDEGVPPADAWRGFARRLQSFRSSGHLPSP
jgi:hypothetical protein